MGPANFLGERTPPPCCVRGRGPVSRPILALSSLAIFASSRGRSPHLRQFLCLLSSRNNFNCSASPENPHIATLSQQFVFPTGWKMGTRQIIWRTLKCPLPWCVPRAGGWRAISRPQTKLRCYIVLCKNGGVLQLQICRRQRPRVRGGRLSRAGAVAAEGAYGRRCRSGQRRSRVWASSQSARPALSVVRIVNCKPG